MKKGILNIFIGFISCALLAGCENADDSSTEPKTQKLVAHHNEPLTRFDKKDSKDEQLKRLLASISPKRHPWLNTLRMPDLTPKIPDTQNINHTIFISFEVKNVGTADSGVFNLEAEGWLIEGLDEAGVGTTTETYTHFEQWPSLAVDEKQKSQNFINQLDLLTLSNMNNRTYPLAICVQVSVDPPSAAKPKGNVIEMNDSSNSNMEMYCTKLDYAGDLVDFKSL